MRALLFTVLSGLLSLFYFNAQGQTRQFMWGQSATTSPLTAGWWAGFSSSAIDKDGNVYGLAEAEGSLSVGPINLARRSDCYVQALVKYDSTGQLLWSKSVLPALQSVPDFRGALRQIAVDADGNLYTMGAFDGAWASTPLLIIDGDTLLRDAYLGCFYVLKWSPAGQLLWAKVSHARRNLRGGGLFLHNTLGIGPTGKVYVGGTTGGNYQPVFIDGDSAINNMHTSWYVVQMSGADGSVDWIRMPGAYQSGLNFPLDHRIERIAADAAGNVYVKGYGSGFRVDAVRFPVAYSVRHQTSNADSTFWVKFGPDGRTLAGRQLACRGGFAVDGTGNSYLSSGSVVGDSVLLSVVTGAPPRAYALGANGLIIKLNPVGAVEWLKPWGGGEYYGTPLATDANGQLYASGSYDASGVSIDSLTLPPGHEDSFVATLDAATGKVRHLLPVSGRKAEGAGVGSASPTGQLAVSIASNSDTTLLGQELVYARVGRAAAKGIISRVSSFTNMVRGAVFVDQNRNSVQDNAEAGYPFGTVVKVMPGNRYFVPSGSGLYQAPVQLGTYSVSLVTAPLYHTVVNLPPATTTFSSFGNEAPGRSVALRPIPGKQDLQVFLSSSIADKEAWSPVHLGLSYRNIGTVAIDSGTVTLVYDSLLTLQHSTTAPDAQVGHALTWKFHQLLPGQVRHIGSDFELAGAALEGDTLRSRVVLEPLAGDLTPGDNQASVTEIVIDSFDADTTTVSFRQISPQQAQGGQWLDYSIRFRNATLDSVYRVVLRDTLPATLRLETLDVLSASHQFEWSLEPGGVLVVRLYGARLGGTANGRPGDEGFVHFRVKPQPGLVVGDLISNRASVYLDDQPAFITASAITTVQAIVTGELTAAPAFGANVWPNPATGMVKVEAYVPQAGALTLRLWDVTGRLALTQQHRVAAGIWQQPVDLSHLPAGLYLLDVQTPTARLSRRLVVQEKQ